MNQLSSLFKCRALLLSALLPAFVAGCGGGGLDPILGTPSLGSSLASDTTRPTVVVTAPAAGEVIDLKFTSAGAVVRPGDTIAEIVPANTALAIEAQIRPEEVNNVAVGQSARIKFTAFKYRNTTMVTGKVTYVSGDRFVDKTTQQPYYSVSILADAQSVQEVGDLKMQAGMPAEVYIDGGLQTALQYLIEPVTSTMRKAARQL